MHIVSNYFEEQKKILIKIRLPGGLIYMPVISCKLAIGVYILEHHWQTIRTCYCIIILWNYS